MDFTITLFRPSLPAEILAWIFIQVCSNTRPCPWSLVNPRRPKFTDYPVILSHVCAAWRNVAIGTTCLWTHIDLDPSLFRDGQSLPRAKTYLSRAGDRLMDIRVMAVANQKFSQQNDLFQLLATISPRAWSITVVMPDRNPVSRLWQRTISSVLDSCVPGVLERLSIEVLHNGFSPIDRQTILNQVETTGEALGHSITVLRLFDFFFQWTSKMYHGLTELRLKGRDKRISELALTSILNSSPKLRVLEIGIQITATSSRPLAVPVLLVDLELLICLAYVRRDEICLLTMIRPGPKPLTFSLNGSLLLSMVHHNRYLYWNKHAIERFCARANITRLIIYALHGYTHLAELLPLTPNVEVLALDYPFETRAALNETILPPAAILNTLYVTITPYSVPYVWPALEQVIRRHGARKIIWWASRAEGGIPDNLFSLCPQVTIVSHEEPNPIQEFLSLNHSSLC